VKGNNTAMVTPGPTPGKTPTTMPKAAPTIRANAIGRVLSEENPPESASMNSIFKSTKHGQNKP